MLRRTHCAESTLLTTPSLANQYLPEGGEVKTGGGLSGRGAGIYGGPEVQIHPLYGYIPSLHDPQFLHSTVTFVHSTAKFLHSTPPVSFTPLQNSFTRRPQIPSLHCKIPLLHAPRFLHSTAKSPRCRVSLSSVCPASAGSRNRHLTVTRVTHYARWRVRCVFVDWEC